MIRTRLSLPDTVELLKRSDFFNRLLPDDLFWLASRCGLYVLAEGESLFEPGQPVDRFYILRSGLVAVSRTEPSGRQREMARFDAGDALGDFDFARGAVHDASARAVGPAETLAFPDFGLCLADLARERPDIGARVQLRSVAMIASRVRSTQKLISENAPWIRELRRQMHTDPATGLWSRAFLEEELPGLVELPAAFIFIKPDRFKELCDAQGHGAGDQAMLRIAELLKNTAREHRQAWAVRLKSNETCLALGGTAEAEAVALATRLAEAFRALEVEDFARGSWVPSASLALALCPSEEPDLRCALDRAAEALSLSWKDGSDRLYRLADLPSSGEATTGRQRPSQTPSMPAQSAPSPLTKLLRRRGDRGRDTNQ